MKIISINFTIIHEKLVFFSISPSNVLILINRSIQKSLNRLQLLFLTFSVFPISEAFTKCGIVRNFLQNGK